MQRAHSAHGEHAPDQPVGAGADLEYACPMHPEVRQKGPGRCPKCGMFLEPVGAPAMLSNVYFNNVARNPLAQRVDDFGNMFANRFGRGWKAVHVEDGRHLVDGLGKALAPLPALPGVLGQVSCPGSPGPGIV